MEDTTVFCESCGKKFDKKHLSNNIHKRLKKNVTHFRKFFKIETASCDNFKFCRKCENEWLELNKLVDKQKIEDFIEEKNTTKDATFQNDDESQYEQIETNRHQQKGSKRLEKTKKKQKNHADIRSLTPTCPSL